MIRAATFVLFASALVLSACGNGPGQQRSFCDQPECAYDELSCYYDPEPNPAYHVIYSAGDEPIAMIDIALWGLEDVGHFTLPVPDPQQRVQITSSVLYEVLADATSLELAIKSGGLEPGKTLKGSLVGQTLGGLRVGVEFDCVLDRIVGD